MKKSGRYRTSELIEDSFELGSRAGAAEQAENYRETGNG